MNLKFKTITIENDLEKIKKPQIYGLVPIQFEEHILRGNRPCKKTSGQIPNQIPISEISKKSKGLKPS
jgi:hypothetical protein